MTFKDLKKRVTLESAPQQTELFERLLNKPFWIWNIEEHKQEDAKTNGDCCFNHIIGLSQKDAVDKPLYDFRTRPWTKYASYIPHSCTTPIVL